MNIKEVGEIRRHIRRDRSNMPAIFGCYVNDSKEIVSEFRSSTGMMSENECEKYYALLKRTLSGTIGKNLIDISFKTTQVTNSPEHKLLMDLRQTELNDESVRHAFYQKVIESTPLTESYLILLGCDVYDVPFKTKDDQVDNARGDETYRFLLCAICPVKQAKATLHYVPEEKLFHDGGALNTVSAPELGFLFPAFDNRATNIYNALYYTRSPKENHASFVDVVFCTSIPKPAAEQKKSFEALLSRTLDDQCSMDVVQTVHEQICQRIEMHKESKIPDPLLINKADVKDALISCGISEERIAKFSIDYDEEFGFEAELHPKNIVDNRKFEVTMPDVTIKVSPERMDLIETCIIDGVKYILICADENVEVNGVSIHINDKEATPV